MPIAAHIAVLLLAALPAAAADAPPGRTPAQVDVALVLVSDVSRSIDDSEFPLEKQGYAAAFANDDVLAAIRGGPLGASPSPMSSSPAPARSATVLDWTVIRDAGSARGFAGRLAAAPRSFWGRTAIGAGIELAIRTWPTAASTPQPPGHRRVRRRHQQRRPRRGRSVRDEAVAAGITINGLAIINDHPVSWTFAHVQPPGGLTNYYRENVTGGPGSFVAGSP